MAEMTEFDGPALADAAAPASVADALAQASQALGFLAGADWTSLPGQVQRDALTEFTRLHTWLVASRTGALLGFDVGNGYRFDGYAGTVPWLMTITRVTKGAAREQSGWLKIFRNHPLLAEALIKASISDSYGKQFAAWNNRLDKEDQEGADQILIDAAAAGLPWDDLARLAQEILERARVLPDDDDGDAPFRDRDAKMERTFGGTGKLTVDLAPEAADLVEKVFDAFGKPLGPDDHRTQGERKHDALQEGLSRLVKAGMIPAVVRHGHQGHGRGHAPVLAQAARLTGNRGRLDRSAARHPRPAGRSRGRGDHLLVPGHTAGDR
jgi:hypothetical protein